MAAELTIRRADGAIAVVRLESDRYSVGRSGSNDFSYPEEISLSRQHLALERRGDTWVVTDLGSRNGTRVNGVRIRTPTALEPGDCINAGGLMFEFSDAAPAQARRVKFIDTPREERSATVALRLDQAVVAPDASRMRAVIQAGTELAEDRPLDELLPLILNLAAGAVGATRGVLMLKEGDALVVRSAKGSGFEISRTVRDRVLVERESLLIQDVQLDEQLREQASLAAHSVRSVLAVPLQGKENAIGLIYLDSPHRVFPFTREDLGLLTVMANIAAIRIENVRLTEVEQHERLMAREMEQAAEIQRNLLPGLVPRLPGLDVAAFNEPCRNAGGDHYDFFERPGGKLILVVGDVAGKGMPAALLMASLQARVQVLVEVESELSALVTRLNRIVAANCPRNRFITFFICELEVATGKMLFVNAGHNPPLLIRRDGRAERLEGGGVILGIFARASFTQHACRMEDGDMLALFTDGVTEAVKPGTGEEFGEERLLETLLSARDRSAAGMIDEVKRAVADFAGSVSASDDFTLVLARKTACE